MAVKVLAFMNSVPVLGPVSHLHGMGFELMLLFRTVKLIYSFVGQRGVNPKLPGQYGLLITEQAWFSTERYLENLLNDTLCCFSLGTAVPN